MHTYLIHPQAPLVFRTGRPFGATGGGETLPFPLPGTVAGALRTAWAEQQPQRPDYAALRETLCAAGVAGPLGAAIGADGSVVPLLPRPADALYLGSGDDLRVWRLQPGELPSDSSCDLPSGLLPVQLDSTAPKGKPAKDAPVFWRAPVLADWLLGKTPTAPVAQHGIRALPVETRTHVALRPDTWASDPGRLFQSGGLDFGARRDPVAGGWHGERYALLARSALDIAPALRRLGGEGRLAHIEHADAWPQPPAGLFDAIAGNRHLRLVLATPALFAEGWRPGWLTDQLEGAPPDCPGLRLRLRACACERWQAHSGWDLTAGSPGKGGQPRAVRRSVPAGAVYWFDVLEGDAAALAALWLAPVSDDPQDRRDGFGLALPGCW